MAFDASGSTYMLAGSGLALGTGDFAIAGWHQDVSGTAGIRTIAAAGTSRAELRANVSGSPGYLGILPIIAISRTFTDLTYNLGLPAWHHYLVTRTSGVLRGYLDGVLSATTHANTSTLTASGVPCVGATNSGLNPAYGPIQDVAIWTRALTSAEAAELFANRYKASAYPTGLVLYYPLNGTSGAIQLTDPGVQDGSGNGRHIVTLTGSPQWTADSPGLIDRPGGHRLLWNSARRTRDS